MHFLGVLIVWLCGCTCQECRKLHAPMAANPGLPLCLRQGLFFHHLLKTISSYEQPKVILWKARQTACLPCGKQLLSETEWRVGTQMKIEQDAVKRHKTTTFWEVTEASFTKYWDEVWTLARLQFGFPWTRCSFLSCILFLSYSGESLTFFQRGYRLCVLWQPMVFIRGRGRVEASEW